MAKFSNRLISLRKERNLTQEDIAKIIYKKRSTVSGYETEGKQPDLDTVCLLAKYFGVSTDYLLGYTDRPNHSEDVFYNDTVNFQKHFNSLPAELRPAVSKCFDDFYRLLNRDMQCARPERIAGLLAGARKTKSGMAEKTRPENIRFMYSSRLPRSL